MSIGREMSRFLVAAAAALPVVAQAGFYLGAAVGQATYEDFDDAPAVIDDGSFTRASADDTDTGTRIFLGMELDPRFSLELGYTDLGEFTVNAVSDGSGFAYAPGRVNMTVGVDGIDLSLVSRLPVGPAGSINIRLGMFLWDGTIDLSDSFGFLHTSDDGSDVLVSFGGEYRLSDWLAVRADYTLYNIDEDNLDQISASLVYYPQDYGYRRW